MTNKEFLEKIDEMVNSPSTRLLGNADSGYVYNHDADPAMLYASKKLIEKDNRIRKLMAEISKLRRKSQLPTIEDVIFNYPATIVLWSDGTKTVVKAQGDDVYDEEKGLAMAIVKKMLGNEGNYYNVFKQWVPEKKEVPVLLQKNFVIPEIPKIDFDGTKFRKLVRQRFGSEE